MVEEKGVIARIESVLEWVADGDAIPYGRDYFVLEEEKA